MSGHNKLVSYCTKRDTKLRSGKNFFNNYNIKTIQGYVCTVIIAIFANVHHRWENVYKQH